MEERHLFEILISKYDEYKEEDLYNTLYKHEQMRFVSGDADETGSLMLEISMTFIVTLNANETIEEFTKKLSGNLWNANGGFCLITIETNKFAPVPSRDYLPDKSTYDEWRKAQNV